MLSPGSPAPQRVAFTNCQRVAQVQSANGYAGDARLMRRYNNEVPAQSVTILWAHLEGGSCADNYFDLMEGKEDEEEWQIAWSLVWAQGGKLALCIRNGSQTQLALALALAQLPFDSRLWVVTISQWTPISHLERR
ncbi:hypothetical protein AAFF_G00093410 [Aldrovandia affinis]|uniref:Uncharacterized protein n=1 Tax=Aldrovandia affinis TaxID=143900 RepID=A0AAD7T2S0_9TELE|nr:hypothetical protein AAFF_G00093410 [Aldrovandia affinis]